MKKIIEIVQATLIVGTILGILPSLCIGILYKILGL